VSFEILAYIGAVVMVVLAVLAYRYWRSTATYARRVRESQARQVREPLVVSAPIQPARVESVANTGEAAEDPARDHALVESRNHEGSAAPIAEPSHLAEENTAAQGAGPPQAEPAEEPTDPLTETASQPVDVGRSEPGEGQIPVTYDLARTPLEPAAPPYPAEPVETPEEVLPREGFRLIAELDPRPVSSRFTEPTGSIAALLKELDQQLVALPSGLELIDLPLLERRRVADRRRELLQDRARLLELRKQGAHRRRGRPRNSPSAE